MSRRTAWTVGFLAGFAAWIAAELLAAFDSDPNTVPLTALIVDHVPLWYGFPIVVAFAVWLVAHFWIYWHQRKK